MINRLFSALFRSAAGPSSAGVCALPNTFCLLTGRSRQDVADVFPRDNYSLLFVMEKEVEVVFSGGIRRTPGAGQFLALYTPLLQSVRLDKGAVAILHIPPGIIAKQFEVFMQSFPEPCSELLPILPLLAGWLAELRPELAAAHGWICSEEKEQQMARHLLASSHSSGCLGEVYIAYLFRKQRN